MKPDSISPIALLLEQTDVRIQITGLDAWPRVHVWARLCDSTVYETFAVPDEKTIKENDD